MNQSIIKMYVSNFRVSINHRHNYDGRQIFKFWMIKHIKFKMFQLESQINFRLLIRIKRIVLLHKTTYIINAKKFIGIL
jgi:hypothetical protein